MMTEQILSQLYYFGDSVKVGGIIAISYELLRLFRKIIRHKRTVINIEDVMFWIIWTILIVLKRINENNELRLFHFCGAILGAVMAICLFEILIFPLIRKICVYFHKIYQKRIMRLKK